VDKFAAEWPASRSLDPKTAQYRIGSLRTRLEGWFHDKETQLIPQKDDPFVAINDTNNSDNANNRNDDKSNEAENKVIGFKGLV